MAETRQQGDPKAVAAIGKAGRNRLIALAAITVLCLAAIGVAYALQPRDAKSAMDAGRYDIARELSLVEARAGNKEAQNTLGNLYYVGLGGSRNTVRAAEWYLKSALAGNTGAQINISMLYGTGDGVPRDDMRAYAWLLHARKNANSAADNQIKWRFGRARLSISQLQIAKEKYAELSSLDPANDDKGSHSGASQ